MSSLRLLVVQVLFLLPLVEFGMALVSDAEWAEYKARYKKHYKVNDNVHRALYDKKVKTVAKHNLLYSQGGVKFKMGLNEFSDTDQSVLLRYRMAMPIPQEPITEGVTRSPGYKRYDQITGGIDWREYGYISAVGNQGTVCYSCWAFSTSGVVEAHLAKKYSKLVSLSPKHLLDCAPSVINGCKGGWVSLAFNFVRENGIATKKTYPYEPKSGACRVTNDRSPGLIRGHVTLTSGDERELAEVVYNIGPVAVSIDHLHDEFDLYFGGILSIKECRSDKPSLTHSVLVVGFGNHPIWGEYWIIKNSYGTEWGESGYFKLARNANNTCGVATLPQYPIV